MSGRTIFVAAPGVEFAVERTGIWLIRRETGQGMTLEYPGAAVWDMASRGYPLGRIVDCLGHIARITSSQAEQIVIETLDRLCERGFVQREPANG